MTKHVLVLWVCFVFTSTLVERKAMYLRFKKRFHVCSPNQSPHLTKRRCTSMYLRFDTSRCFHEWHNELISCAHSFGFAWFLSPSRQYPSHGILVNKDAFSSNTRFSFYLSFVLETQQFPFWWGSTHLWWWGYFQQEIGWRQRHSDIGTIFMVLACSLHMKVAVNFGITYANSRHYAFMIQDDFISYGSRHRLADCVNQGDPTSTYQGRKI